jgi:hypothetical protein
MSWLGVVIGFIAYELYYRKSGKGGGNGGGGY